MQNGISDSYSEKKMILDKSCELELYRYVCTFLLTSEVQNLIYVASL